MSDSEYNDSYSMDAEGLFNAAYEKQMNGDLSEAIELYQRSIALHPTAEAHTLLGWALSQQHQYRDAILECEEAIKIDQEFGSAYNDIGAYLIELGEYDEALKWLQKATKALRYENYCFPHYNMGRIYEKKGDWQQAIRSYQNALIENREYTLAQKALNRLISINN